MAAGGDIDGEGHEDLLLITGSTGTLRSALYAGLDPDDGLPLFDIVTTGGLLGDIVAEDYWTVVQPPTDVDGNGTIDLLACGWSEGDTTSGCEFYLGDGVGGFDFSVAFHPQQPDHGHHLGRPDGRRHPRAGLRGRGTAAIRARSTCGTPWAAVACPSSSSTCSRRSRWAPARTAWAGSGWSTWSGMASSTCWRVSPRGDGAELARPGDLHWPRVQASSTWMLRWWSPTTSPVRRWTICQCQRRSRLRPPERQPALEGVMTASAGETPAGAVASSRGWRVEILGLRWGSIGDPPTRSSDDAHRSLAPAPGGPAAPVSAAPTPSPSPMTPWPRWRPQPDPLELGSVIAGSSAAGEVELRVSGADAEVTGVAVVEDDCGVFSTPGWERSPRPGRGRRGGGRGAAAGARAVRGRAGDLLRCLQPGGARHPPGGGDRGSRLRRRDL